MSEYKIVVYGESAVGKSALVIQFIQHHFIEFYDVSMDDSYRKQVTVDGTPVLLDILDLCGYEEYSAMHDHYFRVAESFILVYSITNRSSFDEVARNRDKILRTKDVFSVPMVLVGNKCDLEGERQVSRSEGEELAKSWGCPFFETSAKLRENVDVIFEQIVREVRSSRGERNANDNVEDQERREKCIIM